LLALKIKLKNESDASGCSSNLTAVGARRGFQSDIPRFPVKNPIAESKDMRMIADPELFSTLITRQVFTPALCKAGPAPHPTRPVRHPFPEKSAFLFCQNETKGGGNRGKRMETCSTHYTARQSSVLNFY
jgi:hypothetical protein